MVSLTNKNVQMLSKLLRKVLKINLYGDLKQAQNIIELCRNEEKLYKAKILLL